MIDSSKVTPAASTKNMGKPGKNGKNRTSKLKNKAIAPAIINLSFRCSDPMNVERKEACVAANSCITDPTSNPKAAMATVALGEINDANPLPMSTTL